MIDKDILKAFEHDVAEATRRFNLNRSDLAALGTGAIVCVKIEDLRYWQDLIVDMYRMIEHHADKKL